MASEQFALRFVGDGKHPDDHPRIKSAEMKLLGGAKEEVQVLLGKVVEVFLSHLRQSVTRPNLG